MIILFYASFFSIHSPCVKNLRVANLISVEWNSLTPENRASFGEMARLNRNQYKVEKSIYTGPWKIPAEKRPQNDPSAPNHAMLAFLASSSADCADTKYLNPGTSSTYVSNPLENLQNDASHERRQE